MKNKIIKETKFNLEKYNTIRIISLKNKVFLLLTRNSKTQYIEIPKGINCELQNNIIIIKSERTNPIAISFINNLEKLISITSPTYKKKLSIIGLGYKANVENNILKLKLGLSHLINIEIPKYIKRIITSKYSILIISNDEILLGDFINKLINIKPTDSYKGKGLSLVDVKQKLKPVVKKTKK